MLVDPGRTPYDVNLRLLGFRIRIHPLFWLGAGLLGSDYLKVGLPLWLIWIAVVLISLTVHELGHALAYRLYRRNSSIVLYVFGGLTIPDYSLSGRSRRIFVSLAGPLAGFLLAGLFYGSNALSNWVSWDKSGYVAFFYVLTLVINISWGILNLLPVYPLDGGQIVREICLGIWRRGLMISLQISVWAALLISLYNFVCFFEADTGRTILLEHVPEWLRRGTLFGGFFFMILAYQSYQLLQQIGHGYYWDDASDR